MLLTEDVLEHEIQGNNIRGVLAADRRMKLVYFKGLGTMCTGHSYALYKKDNGTCTVKCLACPEECDSGGMSFPYLYFAVDVLDDGYACRGTASFSSISEVFYDTLHVSKQFLESDQFKLTRLK